MNKTNFWGDNEYQEKLNRLENAIKARNREIVCLFYLLKYQDCHAEGYQELESKFIADCERAEADLDAALTGVYKTHAAGGVK